MNQIKINIPLCACKKLQIPYLGKCTYTTTQRVQALKDLNVKIPEFISTETIQMVSCYKEQGNYRIIL